MATEKQEVKKVKIDVNVGFIGAGNMAIAIGEGLVRSGVISPSQIYASAPSMFNLQNWKDFGAHITNDNSDIVLNCPVVILSTKPVFAAEAAATSFNKFNERNFTGTTIVSILAGMTVQSVKKIIEKNLPTKESLEKVNVIRTIPNTPIMVGEGATVFCSDNPTTSDKELLETFSKHKDVVKTIFSVNGFCEEVSERLINPIGALSGSGPAYVYQMIEALSDGGVKMGIPRNLATTLAAQTLLGAAKMVLTTGKHPGELKDAVCSPGGTTIAGIAAMENRGVRSGLISAVEAACKRTAEIANETKT